VHGWRKNYGDWQAIASQFGRQFEFSRESLEPWAERLTSADEPMAAKAFMRAAMALDMAHTEMEKAAGLLQAAHDQDHFHIEAFNVPDSADRAPLSGTHEFHEHNHTHPHLSVPQEEELAPLKSHP
jgi:hypothetical protein